MTKSQHAGQCSCGQAQFKVAGAPLIRGFCHCTVCQKFNSAAYADISVYRAADVVLPDSQKVEYNAYKSPPAVQRSKCKSCGSPSVEVMSIFPLPKLIIIPTHSLPDACVIEPSLHTFYERRVSDIDDSLPKHSGYWRSQLAFGRGLISGMMRARAATD